MALLYSNNQIELEIVEILQLLSKQLPELNYSNYHIAIKPSLIYHIDSHILNISFYISTENKTETNEIESLIHSRQKESSLSYRVAIHTSQSRIKRIVLALNNESPKEIHLKLGTYFLTEQFDGTFIIFEDRREITAMVKDLTSNIYGISL